ncbi:alpha/beta hydrolase family protein [Kordiimonas sp.]|uniref:alpha/beta hydrolase family protein n=1 Tax=Kordiimonas sp. TaxID=1970157 RepID=UPI003A914CA4
MTGPFEILVFGILLVALVLSFLPKKHFARAAFIASGIAFAGFVAVSTFGTPRGPLVPGALLALILAFVTFCRLEYPKPNNWRRRSVFGVYIALSSALAVIAIILPIGFPVFEPPAPAGPYAVGYARSVIPDDSRLEAATEDAGDHRELPVQVWYPAKVPEGEEALPFIPDSEQAAHLMGDNLGLPLGFFDYLEDIRGYSYQNALVAAHGSRFPVLVFSHGFGSIGAQNTLLMEHLASFGYVVFSLEHPYQAAWVRLGDERTATFDPKGFRDVEMTEGETEGLIDTIVQMADAEDYNSYLGYVSDLINNQASFITGLRLWTDDTVFFLDQLQAGKIPEFSSLYRSMDMDRLGIFGMSYGGAAAGMVCLTDTRCKAGINMDGLQFGEHDMTFPISRPFMIMNSDANLFKDPDARHGPAKFKTNDFVYRQAVGPIYSLTVGGAHHMNYSDFAHLMPLAKQFGMFGPVSSDAMNRIMNDYVKGFFDRHLKGEAAPILDGASLEHPDVLEFVHRNVDEGTLVSE